MRVCHYSVYVHHSGHMSSDRCVCLRLGIHIYVCMCNRAWVSAPIRICHHIYVCVFALGLGAACFTGDPENGKLKLSDCDCENGDDGTRACESTSQNSNTYESKKNKYISVKDIHACLHDRSPAPATMAHVVPANPRNNCQWSAGCQARCQLLVFSSLACSEWEARAC